MKKSHPEKSETPSWNGNAGNQIIKKAGYLYLSELLIYCIFIGTTWNYCTAICLPQTQFAPANRDITPKRKGSY